MADKSGIDTPVVEQIDAIFVEKPGQSQVQFDAAAERRLRTKIDLFIVPIVAVMYLFCFIDRANIGNARLAGFETDLGLTGNDYNTALSIFYISYILFEIPTTLFCKWLGPGWFLPLTTIFFGLISVMTGFVRTKSQVCAVRFLLGIFEAGMMPGIAYYLSRWYCRAELSFRIGLYLVMSPLSGAFGGLLASGILKLSRFGPRMHTWRMIFGIEGVVTICVGLFALCCLTDRPETARWLSDDEKALAVARVQSERVAQAELLEKMSWTRIARAASPVTLATAFTFMLNNVTVFGISFFLPTIIKTIYPDKTTIQQQLLTVPPYAVGAGILMIASTLSWRFDHRQLFIVASGPLVMAGYSILLRSQDAQTRYGAIFLCASSAFIMGVMNNSQASANVVSDTTRSAAIGINVMFGNMGGLIATWTYLRWDAPKYRIGNGVNLACAGLITIVSMLLYLWMLSDNKKRDARSAHVEEDLARLTPQQIEELDWKHPLFRWRP